MTETNEARARVLLASAAVSMRRDPSADAAPPGEPADLTALYAVSDGLELADGTRILGRAEVAPATAWLVVERSLEWDADRLVIGERDDLVIVRDLDHAGQRAGGGVLEAPTDGLTSFRRAALDVLGYLVDRAGIPGAPGARAPEALAREAVARRDAAAIVAALAPGFYPGAEREMAHALLTLGAIRAGEGDEAGSMEAFTQAVAAMIASVPRGAEASEARAGWRTAAIVAEKAGAGGMAAACRARAGD
jgi:hypothetical protein